jgi:hypothetical protein
MMSIRSSTPDELLIQAFAKLDRTALGIALGILAGLVVFLATNILLLKGGSEVGPNLGLLSQFFTGYSVTFEGSLIGLAYGFTTGFLAGWLIAFLHNLFIRIYFYWIQWSANLPSMMDYIDPDHSQNTSD